MRIYSRIMQGPARPIFPNAVVYLCGAVLLAVAVVIEPAYMRAVVMSPVGVAAGLAIVLSFLLRRFMSPAPWVLVAGALLLDVGARILSGSYAYFLSIGSYLALGVGLVVWRFQLQAKITDARGRLVPSPARWGSVIVAGALLLGSGSMDFVNRMDEIVQPATGSPQRQTRLGIRKSTDYGSPMRAGRLRNPAITESSGIVASRENPGRWWTHNDSGGDPVVYCLDVTGRSCGSWQVSGASVTDWEALAVGPGPATGRSYLYIGDIGDNAHDRPSITVYRVPEPDIASLTSRDPEMSTEDAAPIVLRYPDRPHDAEALMVHPQTGDLYIVTKDVHFSVFKAEAPVDIEEPIVLDRIAKRSISNSLSEVTGGDISPDGRRLVLSTYLQAYELILPKTAGVGSFDLIWKQPFVRIDVGRSNQREAIAYSVEGEALFVSSEGRRSPLFEVPRRL